MTRVTVIGPTPLGEAERVLVTDMDGVDARAVIDAMPGTLFDVVDALIASGRFTEDLSATPFDPAGQAVSDEIEVWVPAIA